MFCIIWRYRVKPEQYEKFEFEYGSQGTWSRFFEGSQEYKGSRLHKSIEYPREYLLIDHWENKESYDNFIKANSDVYRQISAEFEYLYESEEKMGFFNTQDL